MKILRILLVVALNIFGPTCIAQVGVKTLHNYANDALFCSVVEIMPVFSGGDQALMCFIESKLDFALLKSVDTVGLCYYAFTIDTMGNCQYKAVDKSLDLKLDLHLKAILNSLPQWTFGEKRGIKETVEFLIPLRIPYNRRWCED